MTPETTSYVQDVQELRTLVLEQVDTCEFFSPEEKKNLTKQLSGLDTKKDLVEMKETITNKISALSKSIA